MRELEEALERVAERVLRRLLAERDGVTPAPAAEGDVLSQASAAAYAGVGVSTIREWQARGHISRGRKGRVVKAELVAFLARGRQSQPKDSPEAKALAILDKRGGRHG